MVKCYICKYYDPKRMSLFRIPNRNDEYSERSGLWLKILGEKQENVNNIRICSEHFLKKKPSKQDDYLNVDWVPNKNLKEYSRNFKFVEYYYRSKKRSQPDENQEKRVHVDVSHEEGISCTTSVKSPNTIILPEGTSLVKSPNEIILLKCTNSVKSPNTIILPEGTSLVKSPNEITLPEGIGPVKPPNTIALPKGAIPVKSPDEVTLPEGIGSVNPLNTIALPVGSSPLKSPNTITLPESISPVKSPNTRTLSLNTVISSEGSSSTPSSTIILPISLKKRKMQMIEEKLLFPKSIQTNLTSEDIDHLFQYYQEVVEERNNLLLIISTLVIDVEFIKDSDKKTRFYTGLPTWKTLNHFFQFVENFLPEHGNCKLSPFQMLVLTLMKFRLNLKFTDLAYRFQIQVSTASQYFHRCVCILYKKFYDSDMICWPEDANLLTNTPSYFRCVFKDTIIVIVDCFELFIERSAVLRALAQLFSKYKQHVTIKFLIGISTTGAIIFISKAFGGRCSDKEIVLQSKFLDKLKDGDVVLSDKGFLIEDEVASKNATLKMPSFVRNGNQLDPIDVEESRYVSSMRIHVERLISVLREKYNICSDVALMSAISKQNDMFNSDLYDKIVFLCCCLVNMCPSVVKNSFEM